MYGAKGVMVSTTGSERHCQSPDNIVMAISYGSESESESDSGWTELEKKFLHSFDGAGDIERPSSRPLAPGSVCWGGGGGCRNDYWYCKQVDVAYLGGLSYVRTTIT